jgi:PAS domain S-box-containing protein
LSQLPLSDPEEPSLETAIKRLETKVEDLEEAGSDKGLIKEIRTELAELRKQASFRRKGASFYLQLLDTLDEGFTFVNPKGQLEFVNEQFCKILGYGQEEVIGSFAQDMIYSEGHPKTIEEKLKLRKRGVSDSYEIQIRHKLGHPVWMRIKAKPVFDSKGEFIGSMSLHYDISDEIKTKEELRKSKEELEMRVLNRTQELRQSNYQLQQEIRQRRIAQIELEKSRKRIYEIFQSSPDAIFVEDFDGKILSANDAAVSLLGYDSREELVGINVFETLPEELQEKAKRNFLLMTEEQRQSFESKSKTKDGRIIPIDITARQIEYNSKPAVLLHVRDISERKAAENLLKSAFQELEVRVQNRTKDLEKLNRKLKKEIEDRKHFEKELQKQQSYLRTIIDTDPNMIFVKDAEGRFVMVNQAVANIYNTSVEDLIGKDNAHFNKKDEELISFHEQDKKVITTQQPVVIPEDKVTNPKTGETRFYQTIKVPISFDENQSVSHILGVSTDITDLIEAREEAAEVRDLYREIARNIPNSAIYLVNGDYKYILAEGPDVEFFGLPKHYLEGRTIFEALDQDTLNWLKPIYDKALQGDSEQLEFTYKNRHFNLSALPIFDNRGKILYAMVLFSNVTTLKTSQIKLEERAAQLVRSNEDLEKFAYVASHDLQEPLRSVASYVQLLQNRYQSQLDEEADEFIGFAIDGVKRMQMLIQDLLSYSRISFKEAPYQECNLNNVVKAVQRNLEETVTKRGAKIICSDLPTLPADNSQMLQLMQNMVENAIKFCREKEPIVKINSKDLGDEWEISIEDNGIGIEDEFLDKIFVIFQRLHSRSDYDGTGIGLAICKKIVERHKGNIRVESQKGIGTTFYFTLPKQQSNSY